MGTSSCIDYIKRAKKEHKCSWCGEKILLGESYKRWRWYDSSDVTTCKLHDECFNVHSDKVTEGECEFSLYDNCRGRKS